MTKLTEFESTAGAEQGNFDANAGGRKPDNTDRQMDGSPVGHQVMEAIQSTLPKVTSYPY